MADQRLYTTDRHHAGWFCHQCGDVASRRGCKHCGSKDVYEVLYFPSHEAAAAYEQRVSAERSR